jgi:hypothetical protein
VQSDKGGDAEKRKSFRNLNLVKTKKRMAVIMTIRFLTISCRAFTRGAFRAVQVQVPRELVLWFWLTVRVSTVLPIFVRLSGMC